MAVRTFANAEAAIFDLDGTLYDSEPLFHKELHSQTLRSGYPLTLEFFETLRGLSLSDIKHQLTFFLPDWVCEHQIVNAANDAAMQRIRVEGGLLQPGAAEIIAECEKRGIPRAIATSSDSAWAHTLLGEMRQRFDHIVTADCGCPTKPAPDLILRAMALLRVRAEACVVFEDSPRGVQAARAAGVDTIFYVPDGTHNGAVPRGAVKVKDLFEARDILSGMRRMPQRELWLP